MTEIINAISAGSDLALCAIAVAIWKIEKRVSRLEVIGELKRA